MKNIFLLPVLLLLSPLFAGDLDLYGITPGETNIFEATEKIVKSGFKLLEVDNNCPTFKSVEDSAIVNFSHKNNIVIEIITVFGTSSTVSEIISFLDTNIGSTKINYNNSLQNTNFNIIGDKYTYYIEIRPDYELALNKVLIQANATKNICNGIAKVGDFAFGSTKEEVTEKIKKYIPLSIISTSQDTFEKLEVDHVIYKPLEIDSKIRFVFKKNKLMQITIDFPSINREDFYKIVNSFINNYNLEYKTLDGNLYLIYTNEYGSILSYKYENDTFATFTIKNTSVLLY